MADNKSGINSNAMFQAGFASKAKVTTQQDAKRQQRADYWSGIAKGAYNVLGKAALGQMERNYVGLQKYRDLGDSQLGINLLQVNKMPEDNLELKQDIADLGVKYGLAAKAAHYGFGKKRSKGRADAAMYLKQLHDMNADLTAISESVPGAQDMINVASGRTQAGESAVTMSPGDQDPFRTDNTTQLAAGLVQKRLRWNSDPEKGPIGMNVKVGGEWRDDETTGISTYVDKLETGTYEDYVAQDEEMYSKLDQKYEKYYNETAGEGVSDQNIQSREEWNKSQGIEQGLNTSLLSREEWTKQNQENRGAVSLMPYSKLKFVSKEDKIMGETIVAGDKLLAELAYQENSPDWNTVSDVQNGKNEFAATVNGYSDAQFKDFFFGGYSYDYSNNRMTETAPAYILMKAEVEKAGGLDENGNFKEGFGPGTEDWEGQLLMLRGQSFVRGSEYRKQTIEQQWEIRKEKYEANQEAWRDDNPEDPQWKLDGYPNKGAAEKYAAGNTGEQVNQLNPFGSTDNDYVDDGSTKGKYLTGSTRNNKRRSVMNMVQNKPNAGTKYPGILGDYIWNGETWDIGEKSISTTEMMKDEKIFFPDGNFENNLTRKQVETKTLELSSLGNAKNVGEVFSAIKSTYNDKNNAIKKSTGSIGGLSVRKSGQSIYIMVDGVEKEFSLGSAGGFGGTSVNERKRISYLTNLESLLNAVNSSLNPEYTNTDYNSTNNTN
tara:strand:- start:2341 stop:4491 length:2151 start_codon:yes stop_codon:yes gene_type:complete